MKTFMMVIMILTLPTQLMAKSFGVVGDIFPIAEQSFLQLILTRLAVLSANGELDTLNQRWLHTVASHVERPTSLALPRTLRASVHYYQPEVILKQAITTSDGRVLYPAGTQVNALAELPFYMPCWLFLDADDSAQITWAAKEMLTCAHPKIILTGGSVSQAEKILKTVIYYDQAGRLSEKMAIRSVPTRVKREGNQLRIEALAIKENGDVV